MTFRYFYTFLREEPKRPRGMFMFNLEEKDGGRYDTIAWHGDVRRWRHDPSLVGYAYFGEDVIDERKEVTREQAEQIARQWLGTELPSEAKLMLISDKGERDRQRRERWRKLLPNRWGSS